MGWFNSKSDIRNKIMDIDYVPQLYTEFISDPMKELVRAGNPSHLEEHKAEYLKLVPQRRQKRNCCSGT